MYKGAAPQINGLEWRTLLGPTYNWPTPTTEFNATAQEMVAIERCELCGKPVGDGKPYFTNSAGQQPTHVACSRADELKASGHRSAGTIWPRWLQKKFGSP
jgi:hypothetical protein